MSNTLEQPPAGIGTGIATLFTDLGILGFLQPGIVKAISHLIYGVADIPVAYLEGYADSIRSTTEARRHLRLEAARSLASGFETSSDLAARAYAQHATKILKEQVNVEDILGIAIDQLSKSVARSDPQNVPDDDWLAALRNEAGQRSSEEIKLAFGKILAGEIESPGTYSIRTVRTLGMMDTSTAALFRRICNMVFVIPNLSHIAIAAGNNSQGNALKDFDVSFFDLNILQENRLIIPDYNSWVEFTVFGETKGEISCAGNGVRLFSVDGEKKQFKVKVHGVVLSGIGEELYKVVDLEANQQHFARVASFLKGSGKCIEWVG